METEKERRNRIFVESFTLPTIRSEREIEIDAKLKKERDDAFSNLASRR